MIKTTFLEPRDFNFVKPTMPPKVLPSPLDLATVLAQELSAALAASKKDLRFSPMVHPVDLATMLTTNRKRDSEPIKAPEAIKATEAIKAPVIVVANLTEIDEAPIATEKAPASKASGFEIYQGVGYIRNTVNEESFIVGTDPHSAPTYHSNDFATILGGKYTFPINAMYGVSVGGEYNILNTQKTATTCTNGAIWDTFLSGQRSFYVAPIRYINDWSQVGGKIGYAKQIINTSLQSTGAPIFVGDTHGITAGASYAYKYAGFDVNAELSYTSYTGGSIAHATSGTARGYSPTSDAIAGIVRLGYRF